MKPLFELSITAAQKGSRDVAGQLFRQLKHAILERRLTPGSRLPPTRDAKALFGVSRNTAQDVYDRLAEEGLIGARHGSGTFVRAIAAANEPSSRYEEQPGSLNPFWERADIRSWIGFWHDHTPPKSSPHVVADLRPSLVDQRIFPHAMFRQVMARQLRQLETQPASMRSPQGNQGNFKLRQAIAEHVGLTRAVGCNAEDVLVTSGAQQAFDLIARALVRPGDTLVAVEDPGYPPLRVPFAAAGARIVPVPVDRDGIVVDQIPRDAKIICVCPSHQYPLGMTMTAQRREALLRFANDNGAIIVEDDYDGEFRYDGSPLEALRGSRSASRVFYVGSFSKCMFPALRLGFVVLPEWAMSSMVAVKNATDWHSAVPIQAAVAAFIADGHMARHIRSARRIYQERRDGLTALLRNNVGEALTLVPSLYGMHLAATAAPGIDCEVVSEALAEQGIMIHSLARYELGAPSMSGLVFGYAAANLEKLEIAVNALAQTIRDSQ